MESRDFFNDSHVQTCEGMTSGGGDTHGGISRSKDGIPQWSGDPATFSAFEEESFLWEQTQPWHQRHTCASKLKAELS